MNLNLEVYGLLFMINTKLQDNYFPTGFTFFLKETEDLYLLNGCAKASSNQKFTKIDFHSQSSYLFASYHIKHDKTYMFRQPSCHKF